MDLSSLSSLGPWGILIGMIALVLWQRYGPKQPNNPTPSPLDQSNPLAALLQLLLSQWMAPKEPAVPAQPTQQPQSVQPESGPINDAAEAALANIIRADPERRDRLAKLLAK